MSLVGRFELEVFGSQENFAVFAEILLPLAPDMDRAKQLILDAAAGELAKITNDAAELKVGKIEVLDPANAVLKVAIKNPKYPNLLILGVFRKGRQFVLEYSILEKEQRIRYDTLEVNVAVRDSKISNEEIQKTVTQLLKTTERSAVLRELRGSLSFKAIFERPSPLRFEAPPLIQNEVLTIFPPIRSKETPAN